eukprot:m.80699 g.80699  ORF g.80699 m.80699 type:complete len:434 (+) comp20935_c0_seq1:2228-3529(+)
MFSLLLSVVTMWLLVLAVVATSVVGEDCSGPHNTHAIWTKEPTLVRTADHGKLYKAEAQEYNSISVLHVYGTPYEMGYAQGELMKTEIEKLFVVFYDWIYAQIQPYIKWLPKDIQKIIEEQGVKAALDFTIDLTKPYMPQHFINETQGLADAMNVSFNDVMRFQVFPELIKASCTMFGAWGDALEDVPNTLVQLRALDWGLDNPLANFSTLTVYHPNAGDGHEFATLGWSGFLGSVTAYSQHMAVSEKVWLKYNETASRAGVPWNFLLRDIAQYDKTFDDSFNRMINSARTCSIFIGLGSTHANQFRVVEYSHEELYFFDDVNYPAYAAHPLMKNLVYVDKHTQPSNDPCLATELKNNYGKLDAKTTVENIISPFGTGDLHAAVYEFGQNLMFVGIAGVPIDNGTAVLDGSIAPAYSRPWFQFNMTQLFAQSL